MPPTMYHCFYTADCCLPQRGMLLVKSWLALIRAASASGSHLFHYGTPTANALLRLSRDLPGGLLFPRLEWLSWDIWDIHEVDTIFPFFRLLSPNLGHITLYIPLHPSNISQEYLGLLVQVISLLPTSLEYLFVRRDQYPMAEEPLKDAMSSFVCQCGPSLRTSGTSIPLSEVAIHHMRLLNLSYWCTAQGPP